MEDSNQSTPIATNDTNDYVVSEHPHVQCQGMHTRLQDNIQKPKQYIDGTVRYSARGRALTVTTLEPSYHTEALQDEN